MILGLFHDHISTVEAVPIPCHSAGSDPIGLVWKLSADSGGLWYPEGLSVIKFTISFWLRRVSGNVGIICSRLGLCKLAGSFQTFDEMKDKDKLLV
jgi:hypothetical protein